MKKTLSFILTLVLCLSLCTCKTSDATDKTSTPEAPLETISVEELFEALTIGAKCQLNVGKQVTVLGQVAEITSNHCRIKLISLPKESMLIRLPIEKLAELSVDKFIAATGIVGAYLISLQRKQWIKRK